MVKVAGGDASTSLLPKGRASTRFMKYAGGMMAAVLFVAVATHFSASRTTFLLQHPTAARAMAVHLQMLADEEVNDMIPDTRAADQSGVEEGMVRYVILNNPIELPECGTDHCKMMRACMVHAGEEEKCFEVPPLCPLCGERKPCYYAFGKCRLRNGYGPKTEIQPAGNASTVMSYARNHTETVNVDTKAIKRVLGSLQPQVFPQINYQEVRYTCTQGPWVAQYRKHLQYWDWKTRRYLPNHDFNEGVRRRWIRRKTGKYVPKGELTEENAAADAKSVELEWCNWGEEMVPCAPGFGGAWYKAGHRQADYGIWPMEEESGPVSHSPHHVYAGERSDSYLGHHNPIPQPDAMLFGAAQDAQPEAEEKEEEEKGAAAGAEAAAK